MWRAQTFQRGITVDRSAALAEGTAVARSYGSADAPPGARELAPRVGLQRWVLPRPHIQPHPLYITIEVRTIASPPARVQDPPAPFLSVTVI